MTSPISSSFPRGPSPTSPAYQSVPASTTTSDSTETPSTTEVSVAEEEAEVHNSLMADTGSDTTSDQNKDEEDEESRDILPEPTSSPYPSNVGRPGIGTIPRTIPLYLNGNGSTRTYNRHGTSHSISSLPSNTSSSLTTSNQGGEAEDLSNVDEPIFNEHSYSAKGGTPLGRSNSTNGVFSSPGARSFGNIAPLTQTSTGTRYGVALGGGNTPIAGVGVQMTGSPRKWGGGTPTCPRCMKSVYFAEQVCQSLCQDLFINRPF